MLPAWSQGLRYLSVILGAFNFDTMIVHHGIRACASSLWTVLSLVPFLGAFNLDTMRVQNTSTKDFTKALDV